MGDIDTPVQAPGWMLVERMPDDSGEHQPTGRRVGGLHESNLSADPSGREGPDLFAQHLLRAA